MKIYLVLDLIRQLRKFVFEAHYHWTRHYYYNPDSLSILAKCIITRNLYVIPLTYISMKKTSQGRAYVLYIVREEKIDN